MKTFIRATAIALLATTALAACTDGLDGSDVYVVTPRHYHRHHYPVVTTRPVRPVTVVRRVVAAPPVYPSAPRVTVRPTTRRQTTVVNAAPRRRISVAPNVTVRPVTRLSHRAAPIVTVR